MSEKLKEPAMPECEKLHAVIGDSQAIGEFLSIFLSEKGIKLCTFREAGNNGKPAHVWKPETKIARRDGVHVSKRDPMFHDVFNGDAVTNPEYEVWPDEYQPVHTSVAKLLAEYFEIDLNKVEQEKQALLEFIRQKGN